MSSDAECLFCKMASGAIPVAKLLENEHGFVIADIHPQAKKHFLVIPKKHVRPLADGFGARAGEGAGAEGMKNLFGELGALVFAAAEKFGLHPEGFRTVINTNAHGGQSVYHLHLHLLGGEALSGSFA